MLDQCRRKRVVADYEMGVDFEREFAHAVVADSRRIFDRSASLLHS